jgi:hypothetical protein
MDPLDELSALIKADHRFDKFLTYAFRARLDEYAFFLIDHKRGSTSTHSSWWNHLEDALSVLGGSCHRIANSFSDFDKRDLRKKNVFLYFGASSIFGVRGSLAMKDHIPSDALVGGWQLADELSRAIGHEKTVTMLYRGEADGPKRIFWDPFAPVHLIPMAIRGLPQKYDFGYFGTINQGNYDVFENILIPLAREHSYNYRGLSWWRYKLPYIKPLFVGFSPRLLVDTRGFEALLSSRVDIVLHHRALREARSLTERSFYSLLAGRPFVSDNSAILEHFSGSSIKVVDIGTMPTKESSQRFLEACKTLLKDPDTASAQENQDKTIKDFTYFNTVSNLMDQMDPYS